MYTYITLREKPDLKETAAEWFHNKFGVPAKAYLDCMEAYLKGETEYGWYLCLDGDRIVGGMGVIENDFHDRKDLSPNICAVFTETEYRCKGIAGHLLNMVVEDLRTRGISPVYLSIPVTSITCMKMVLSGSGKSNGISTYVNSNIWRTVYGTLG